MTRKNETFKFNVGDIVTISRDYEGISKLDIAQPQIQVFSVMAINTDGTIKLAGVWPDIPTKYIVGVPIESKLARQIYYDTNHARPYEPGKIYPQEDVSLRQPFMNTMEERLGNTPLWEKMQAEKFHFVHELQHWLIDHMGASRIAINQFFGKPNPIEI